MAPAHGNALRARRPFLGMAIVMNPAEGEFGAQGMELGGIITPQHPRDAQRGVSQQDRGLGAPFIVLPVPE
ncbi:MAG TPA: hypothetical protein VGF67_05075, partial [Ktedonobacteraceae bacterium]